MANNLDIYQENKETSWYWENPTVIQIKPKLRSKCHIHNLALWNKSWIILEFTKGVSNLHDITSATFKK